MTDNPSTIFDGPPPFTQGRLLVEKARNNPSGREGVEALPYDTGEPWGSGKSRKV